MKRFHFIAVFFLIVYTASAQVQKGQKILGGQVSVDYSTDKSRPSADSPTLKDKLISFRFNPSVGYMVSKNWALGGNLTFRYLENHLQSYSQALSEVIDYRDIRQELGFGLYAERYFKLIEALYFRVRGGADFIYSQSKRDQAQASGTSKSINRTFQANISPGLSYFLNEKIALNISWQALAYSVTNVSNEKIHAVFDANLNISRLSFGLEWYF